MPILKSPLDRKPIKKALAAGLSLYWEARYGWLRLYAVTYTYENGGIRSRKLFSTEYKQEAIELNTELIRAGAKIDKGMLTLLIRENIYHSIPFK